MVDEQAELAAPLPFAFEVEIFQKWFWIVWLVDLHFWISLWIIKIDEGDLNRRVPRVVK
jgi:hypothetical protein